MIAAFLGVATAGAASGARCSPGPALGFKQGMAAGCRNGSGTLTNRAGTVNPCPSRWARHNQRHSRGPGFPAPPEGRSRLIPVPPSARSVLRSPSGPRCFPPPWAAISLTFAPRCRTPAGGLLLTPLAAHPARSSGRSRVLHLPRSTHTPRQQGASPPVSTRLSTKVSGHAPLPALHRWPLAPVPAHSPAGPFGGRPPGHPLPRVPGPSARNPAEQQAACFPRGRSPGPAPPQQVPEPASRFLTPHDVAIPPTLLPRPPRRC